jgi:uncharacterized membrane protein (UPF0127 family)
VGTESHRVPDSPPNVSVTNTTRGTTVGRNIRVARSLWARGRGLMGVGELPDDSGLVIDPCSSIHMFFMRVPLDVIYLNRDDVVVRVQRNIRPWRVGPLHTRGAKYVIELPVGTIDRSQTDVGDQLKLTPLTSGQRTV